MPRWRASGSWKGLPGLAFFDMVVRPDALHQRYPSDAGRHARALRHQAVRRPSRTARRRADGQAGRPQRAAQRARRQWYGPVGTGDAVARSCHAPLRSAHTRFQPPPLPPPLPPRLRRRRRQPPRAAGAMAASGVAADVCRRRAGAGGLARRLAPEQLLERKAGRRALPWATRRVAAAVAAAAAAAAAARAEGAGSRANRLNRLLRRVHARGVRAGWMAEQARCCPRGNERARGARRHAALVGSTCGSGSG